MIPAVKTKRLITKVVIAGFPSDFNFKCFVDSTLGVKRIC